MAINSKQLAELANVSRSSVQRALSNHPSIAKETKEKIIALAKEYGYVHNKAAQSLVMRQKKISYGVIFHTKTNKYYLDVLEGINKAKSELKESGIDIKVVFQNQMKPDEQVEQIEQFVEEGCKGIVLIPFNTSEVKDALNKCIKKGIKIVTIATEVKDVDDAYFFGQDNYNSGRVAGELMCNMINGNDKIACFLGSYQYLGHTQRIQGFVDKLKECERDDSLVEILENYDNPTKSVAAARLLLKKHHEVKGIFISGAGVEEICRVVEEAGLGKELKIICYELTKEHVTLCYKGIVTIILDQGASNEGYNSLKLLNELVAFNKESPKILYSPIDIRTCENI